MVNINAVFLVMLVVAYFAALAYFENAYCKKAYISNEEYLASLAKVRQCSVYDLFRLSGVDWRFSNSKIETDFKAYLKTGNIPQYVVNYAKQNIVLVGPTGVGKRMQDHLIPPGVRLLGKPLKPWKHKCIKKLRRQDKVTLRSKIIPEEEPVDFAPRPVIEHLIGIVVELAHVIRHGPNDVGMGVHFCKETLHAEDIHHIVEENMQLLSSVQGKDIRLVNEIPRNAIGFADSNTINLVIRNLMTNAIKFTNDGGEVKINAREKGSEWLVSVTDNGVGMNREVLKMLFDKTAPYTTRGTANEKGTGLGLILCKEFMEKNGGKIWVESEEGKGSTFYFTLPKAN